MHYVYSSGEFLFCLPQFLTRLRLFLVDIAFGWFKWTFQSGRTRQTGNQGPQGSWKPSRSLQWAYTLYEGDGWSNLREIMRCKGFTLSRLTWSLIQPQLSRLTSQQLASYTTPRWHLFFHFMAVSLKEYKTMIQKTVRDLADPLACT